ncbi:54S ribosomal protein img2, mitochondrial [Colletotrichum chlorophyti]|uniref:Large ribosomal subunit protein mL49 n=1 Tax=Colletotrichum chlorophyti TaxID=708187 RepID=A0A1Q8RXA6_9PEZI|nr:54S ribosomal protein img2, mitochondrial [Colletotrichum chlorophyti]
MCSALTKAALTRPSLTSLLGPRSSVLLPTIRLSSTSVEPPTPRQYAVGLTASNSFPVYTRTKAAGQSKFTVVKKIEGNKNAFAKDLAREAGFPADEVKLNPVTGHVQVKGFHVEKVKEWLDKSFRNPAQTNTTTATAA